MLDFNNGTPFGEDGEGWKQEEPAAPREGGLSKREMYGAILDMAKDDYYTCSWRVIVKMLLDLTLYAMDASPELRTHLAGEIAKDVAERIRQKYEEEGPCDAITEKALRAAHRSNDKMLLEVLVENVFDDSFLEPAFRQLRRRLGKKPKA